jgi:radical SAM protein with 4Fe4S-binding SPASM domain
MSNHLNIKNVLDYKFIIVEATSACNLKCSYCYYVKSNNIPTYSIDQLLKALDIYEKYILCFIGGEPFLNLDFIENVIIKHKTLDKKVVFASNTNGTCFKNIKPELLNSFSVHHVSVDGYQENHDKYRGKGVFNDIIENIFYLRKYSEAGLIARMTVTDPDQLNDIPHLKEHFDACYWQLNNTISELPNDFSEKYAENITKLFAYWKNNIFKDINFTLIPFIGIADLILRGGMKKPFLICGAGKNDFTICTDGNVYPCPESPHRLGKTECFGDLMNYKLRPYAIKKRCTICEITKFCGGRCAMTDNDLYCHGIITIYNLLKNFISNLDEEHMKKLNKIIEYQKSLAYTTEIIP